MRGWVAVVGADHDFQLAQHLGRFFLAGAHHRQGAHALAVQAEAFAERGGDKDVEPRGHELADHRAVFGDALGKALVGHVEEGGQLAGLHHLDHLRPLRWRDVVARRVVAAGVQHHDGAGRGGLQVGQHAVEVQAARGGVVVAVGAHLEAGLREQRAVVLPARVADQHLGVGAELLQKVGADLQPARAAQRLHRGHAALRDDVGIGAEHQLLHRVVVGGNAVDRQVAARLRRVHQRLLGRLHAGQQRQLAVLVEVHADAQVDLVGVGVGGKLLVQTQDRVAGGHFDGGKQRHGGQSCGLKRADKRRAAVSNWPACATLEGKPLNFSGPPRTVSSV